MSEESVAVVRAIYEAWEQRTPVDHLVAPDLEYVNPPYAVEGGTVRDRRALGRVLDVYADFRIEDKQFIDAGDEVVVIGVARGTGASGVPIELRQGYVWTIEGGRAIRFRWFNDPNEALRAVGLE